MEGEGLSAASTVSGSVVAGANNLGTDTKAAVGRTADCTDE
jgi:hypothetical protein